MGQVVVFCQLRYTLNDQEQVEKRQLKLHEDSDQFMERGKARTVRFKVGLGTDPRPPADEFCATQKGDDRLICWRKVS